MTATTPKTEPQPTPWFRKIVTGGSLWNHSGMKLEIPRMLGMTLICGVAATVFAAEPKVVEQALPDGRTELCVVSDTGNTNATYRVDLKTHHEPDKRYGMKYLEAVREVFGKDGKGSGSK